MEKKPRKLKIALQEVTEGEVKPEIIKANAQTETAVAKPVEAIEGNYIEMAIQKGASIDTIERMVALYERNQDKQAFKAFHTAMGELQSVLPAIEKNKRGYDGNMYADLDAIVSGIRGLLKQFGFTYRYEYKDIIKPIENLNKIIDEIMEATKKHDMKDKISKLEKLLIDILLTRDIEVTCIVTHKDGHSERTSMIGPEDHSGSKNKIQAIGSSASYLERYALKGAFGLTTTDSDPDGHKKKPKEQGGKEQPPLTGTPEKPLMTPKQANAAMVRMANKGEDILDICKNQFTITPEQMEGLITADNLRLKKLKEENPKENGK